MNWVKQIIKEPLAAVGLSLIVVAGIIAIAGANIRPDSSKDANEQHIAIARKPPGFKASFLMVENKTELMESNWYQGLFFGGLTESKSYYLYDSLATDKEGVQLYWEHRKRDLIPWSAIDLQPSTGFRITDLPIKERTFILGTDSFGRDMLSRLMGGTLISFSVGFISVLISLLIGISLGAIAGYYGGWLDDLIMWFINVIWSIPTLLMVIVITLVMGKGFVQVFVAVGLTMWVEVARIVRGQFLSLRNLPYIESAKAMGYSPFRIIFKHMLPNAIGPVIVISAANFAAAILIEAGLSFLGIGTQIPTPSWGGMIKEHYAYITTDMAYLAILPGLCITVLVLSFMLIGNRLRDIIDVRA